jgi:excinuclease ABC subunit C
MTKDMLHSSLSETHQNTVKSLAETPGVYKFFDNTNTIIYVGKAKNLKKRVSSYFQKKHEHARLRLLVKRIVKIETIHVDNEYDALLLENTLIKQHQPRYNIRLKDDKTYPWICISKEQFPRIFVAHQPNHQKNTCFGPYPSHKTMYAVLDIVRNTYPLRTCKLLLSNKNIEAKKFRVCLQFHINKCLGPCEGKIDEQTYMTFIENSREIIKGNFGVVVKQLKKDMQAHSKNLEFEKAQKLKEKLKALEKYSAKSILAHPSLKNCDVATCVQEDENMYVCNYMRVVGGAVVRSHSFEIQAAIDETTPADVFDHALLEIKNYLQGFSHEVIVPFLPQTTFPDVKFTLPKAGHKKDLLVLSEKNARMFLLERKKRAASFSETKRQHNVVQRIQDDLNMHVPPIHIEAFDNSNIQGAFPVAACVVFKNGKPAPSQYRHYNIKTVVGANDFASMTEVVLRRYKRLLEEDHPIPQLIVIDGGKGQLEAAAKSLRQLGLIDKVKLVSIAKKLETVFAYGDTMPLFLDKKSPTLKILQHLRDEAHRFGISHHRKQRQKASISTQLVQIQGIGKQTATKLLIQFGSIEGISKASLEEIAQITGKTRAEKIKNELRKQTKTDN